MPTPDGWLERLTQRMDERAPRLEKLRSYLEGNPPLPEGADGCQEAYRAFQRKARTNFAETVTDAVANRMSVSNLSVGDSEGDDETARRFWRRNHLSAWSADVHRDMLGLGVGYVCVQSDKDGPLITYEDPEQVIVDCDPRRPDHRRAGLKVFRDEVGGYDEARLHLPGEYFVYRRPIRMDGKEITSFQGGWAFTESGESTGHIPYVPFINRGGVAEFEPHLDILDRINWNTLQRLVIVAMQAYRQRAVVGDLAETDEDGNPIDYGKIFRPGPGALWRLPEGANLWESAQTDISGILESSKEDLRSLAAVTNTPMSSLMPDNTNQSAAGAEFTKEGLVHKTQDRLNRAKAPWEEVVRLGYEVSNLGRPDNVDVQFLPPAMPTMAERYDALVKAREDVPWRTRMTRILGYTGDEVDVMAAERAEDLMIMSGLAGGDPEPEGAPGGET